MSSLHSTHFIMAVTVSVVTPLSGHECSTTCGGTETAISNKSPLKRIRAYLSRLSFLRLMTTLSLALQGMACSIAYLLLVVQCLGRK